MSSPIPERISRAATGNGWFAGTAQYSPTAAMTTYSRGGQYVKIWTDKHGRVTRAVADHQRIEGRGRTARVIEILTGPQG